MLRASLFRACLHDESRAVKELAKLLRSTGVRVAGDVQIAELKEKDLVQGCVRSGCWPAAAR